MIPKLLICLAFSLIPLVVLFAKLPKHGSWWYPDPDRWDYQFKLSLYALIASNSPNSSQERMFVRVIATTLLVLTWSMICFADQC